VLCLGTTTNSSVWGPSVAASSAKDFEEELEIFRPETVRACAVVYSSFGLSEFDTVHKAAGRC